MTKKLILSFLFLISGSLPSFATNTWYARIDGGTPTQCTGLVDAAYPGSGTAQPCAVNHPSWVIGATGTAHLWSGGDTLIIDNVNHSNSTQAQYMIGYGMPNTTGANCATSWTYSCIMDNIPAGPDAAHPTTIKGKGCDSGNILPGQKAQLWGTERVYEAIQASYTSNIDIECLEITDHSTCTEFGPTNSCKRDTYSYGPWMSAGMAFQTVTNATLKYLDIHGVANRGMYWFHAAGNWTWSYVNIVGSGMAGVDTDDPATSDDSWTAVVNMDHSKFDWSGCQENYPITAALDSSANILAHSCSSQGQGTYSDGWGQGDATSGTLNISDTSFSFNTQDGFDSLHARGTGNVNLLRVVAQGNSGNAVKVNSAVVHIEDSILIGNCGFYDTGGVNTLTYSPSTYDNVCRGAGAPIQMAVAAGQKFYITGNTVASNGDIILGSSSGTSTCDANTKIIARNNIFLAGNDINGGDTTGGFYLDSSGGNCFSMVSSILDEDYNQWYGTKEGASGPMSGLTYGTHSRYGSPLLVGQTTLKMTTAPYYQGTDAVNQVYLTSTSPSRFAVTGANSADESVVATCNGDCTRDYNYFSRGTNWDGGAYAWNSSPTSCSALGQSCSTGGDCCSGLCSANVCVDHICGNNVREGTEVCDGTALNSQTCPTQGYLSGTLACLSNCSGYDVSSCSNPIPVVIQHAGTFSNTAVSSIPVTVATTGSNHLMVVYVTAGTAVSSVTDGTSNFSVVPNTNGRIWWLAKSNSGKTSITVNFSVSTGADVEVWEVGGFTSPAVDVASYLSPNGVQSGGLAKGAIVLPTRFADFIVTGDSSSDTATPVSGSPWTAGGDNMNGDSFISQIGYQIKNYQAVWSDVGTTFNSSTAAFKETAAVTSPNNSISGNSTVDGNSTF